VPADEFAALLRRWLAETGEDIFAGQSSTGA